MSQKAIQPVFREVLARDWRTAAALVYCFILFPGTVLSAGPLKIELPPETDSFKQGPGADIANGQCLICHSVEYVATQPPLPRTTWAAEVKKMREKYGAALPEEQVELLVTYLTATYGPQTNAAAPPQNPVDKPSPPGSAPHTLEGEALAAKYACLGCHNVQVKIVGPPYKDIAAKYHDDASAAAKISEQIHKGGSGKWGPVIMPPFPTVTEAETKALADWILSRK